MDVSFVIPCYGCRQTVGFTLKGIMNQKTKRSFEILLIDSSPRGIKEWIRSVYPQVRVVSVESRLGAGPARNLGARKASGEYLAFVDADVAPDSDWLERLLERTEGVSGIQVAGGSIINANPEAISSRILYWIEFSEFLPGLPSGFRRHLSGSNLLIRRTDFENSRGFSSHLAMSEDLEMFSQADWKVFFEASARVRHFHRARWRSVTRHLTSLGYWSGRFRRQSGPRIRGSGLKHFPLLSWLLIPYRMIRILGRIWRHRAWEGLQATVLSVPILLALIHWTKGFCRGIRGKDPE